jgi:3-hydroxyisobutyrate dehydrogenase-like beta-hydroxyacid dehydrogenase
MSAIKTVSIVGVGNMGGAMATNLLSRGYNVYVHDTDDAKCQLCKEAVSSTKCNIRETGGSRSIG